MSKPRIVLIRATPDDQAAVDTDAETRAIRDTGIDLDVNVKVKIPELGNIIETKCNDTERPTVLHFSGHGTAEGQLAFEVASAFRGMTETAPAARQGFVDTLKLGKRIDGVVVSACHSRELAEAITAVVPFAVGWSEKISTLAANYYSTAFYLALRSELSVAEAHDRGIRALKLSNEPQARNYADQVHVFGKIGLKPFAEQSVLETPSGIAVTYRLPRSTAEVKHWALDGEIEVTVDGPGAIGFVLQIKDGDKDVKLDRKPPPPDAPTTPPVPDNTILSVPFRRKVKLDAKRIGVRSLTVIVGGKTIDDSLTIIPRWSIFPALLVSVLAVVAALWVGFGVINATQAVSLGGYVIAAYPVFTFFFKPLFERLGVPWGGFENRAMLPAYFWPFALGVMMAASLLVLFAMTTVVNLTASPISLGDNTIEKDEGRLAWGKLTGDLDAGFTVVDDGCPDPPDPTSTKLGWLTRLPRRRQYVRCCHPWRIGKYIDGGPDPMLKTQDGTCLVAAKQVSATLDLERLPVDAGLDAAKVTLQVVPQLDSKKSGYFEEQALLEVVSTWQSHEVKPAGKELSFKWQATPILKEGNATLMATASSSTVTLPSAIPLTVKFDGKDAGTLTLKGGCTSIGVAAVPNWLKAFDAGNAFTWSAAPSPAAIWLPCAPASNEVAIMHTSKIDDGNEPLRLPKETAPFILSVYGPQSDTALGTLHCFKQKPATDIQVGTSIPVCREGQSSRGDNGTAWSGAANGPKWSCWSEGYCVKAETPVPCGLGEIGQLQPKIAAAFMDSKKDGDPGSYTATRHGSTWSATIDGKTKVLPGDEPRGCNSATGELYPRPQR
jgi:hypothetical protein